MTRSTLADSSTVPPEPPDAQRLLRTGQPRRIEGGPPPAESVSLPFHLGPELVALGAGQLVDPRQQVGPVIVDGQRGQTVLHRVADAAHGDQLAEQRRR